MHTVHSRRMRLLAPLALSLVAGLGALSLRAGGTVDFLYGTDGGVHGEFSKDSGGFGHTLLLPEVAGTELQLFLNDPDGEQVFVNVYGTY